ncbi:amino acid transporter, partial [Trypanosoma conorhini]
EAGAQPLLQGTAREATPSTQTGQPPPPSEAKQEEDTEKLDCIANVNAHKERRGLAKSVTASLATIIPPGGMLSTVFNLASICIGAGILGLPAASNSSGVVMTLAYSAIVGALTVYSLYCLALQMERFGVKTYEGMSRTLLGPVLGYVTAAVRTLNTFGGCVAFIICVADIFRAIFSNADVPKYWKSTSGSRLLTSLVWLAVMLPFVIPRHINSLRYVSTVGIIFVIYFVVMIIFHSAMNGLAENAKHITVAGGTTDDSVHLLAPATRHWRGWASSCSLSPARSMRSRCIGTHKSAAWVDSLCTPPSQFFCALCYTSWQAYSATWTSAAVQPSPLCCCTTQ